MGVVDAGLMKSLTVNAARGLGYYVESQLNGSVHIYTSEDTFICVDSDYSEYWGSLPDYEQVYGDLGNSEDMLDLLKTLIDETGGEQRNGG